MPNKFDQVDSNIGFSSPVTKVKAKRNVVIIPTPKITHKATVTIFPINSNWVFFYISSRSSNACSLPFSASCLNLSASHSAFLASSKAV